MFSNVKFSAVEHSTERSFTSERLVLQQTLQFNVQNSNVQDKRQTLCLRRIASFRGMEVVKPTYLEVVLEELHAERFINLQGRVMKQLGSDDLS
jgi:hypothetical protein